MSLHDPYDPSNIFAKIIAGQAPCVNLFEDDQVIAFMDIFPQSKGHCLIVPKEPARNIFDLSETGAQYAITKVKYLASAVEKALSPDGIAIAQFNGAPAGQSVFHIHFHIIPRWENQDMTTHASGQMADSTELETLAQTIRTYL